MFSVVIGDVASTFTFQVQLLTITGQDCTAGKSVGCFVSQAIDRVVEKRLLAAMSWQGTATKWPFCAFEYVIRAVKSESYLFSHYF